MTTVAVGFTEEHLRRAREIHESAVVIAAHTDMCPDVGQRQRAGEKNVFKHRHLPCLRKGGITGICDHVAGDAPYLIDFPFRNTLAANRIKFGLQGVEAMWRESEQAPDEVIIARSVEDIRSAKRSGRIAIVLCLEGAAPIEDDLSLLSVYQRLGVRVVGLTHDFRNLLADGVRTGGGGGLTALGAAAVREMNRLGIVVDVSHLNEPGFWDVVSVTDAPLHASHSNASALCDTVRNLTDAQLEAIAASGGVVGVHALGYLVTPNGGRPAFDEFLSHIEHMLEVMGEDHVAVGPDLMENWPEPEYTLLWRSEGIPKLEFVYPDEFDSLSKFHNITAGLLARGVDERVIVKVLGENVLRLFEETWSRGQAAVAQSAGER
jgi:membrane dipeptidase